MQNLAGRAGASHRKADHTLTLDQQQALGALESATTLLNEPSFLFTP